MPLAEASLGAPGMIGLLRVDRHNFDAGLVQPQVDLASARLAEPGVVGQFESRLPTLSAPSQLFL